MICRAKKPLYNRRTGETWAIGDELELSLAHARYYARLGNVEIVSGDDLPSLEKTLLEVFVQPKTGAPSSPSATVALQQMRQQAPALPAAETYLENVPSEAHPR